MARRDRGISEIIGSVVLILIVSTLGMFLYSYTLSATGSQRENLQGNIKIEAERNQERFNVIAVWWSGSDLLNLTIINYGKIDNRIADIYIDGNRVASFVSGRGEEIGTSTLGKIIFNAPMTIQSNTTYQIVVVSERGVGNAYNWRS